MEVIPVMTYHYYKTGRFRSDQLTLLVGKDAWTVISLNETEVELWKRARPGEIRARALLPIKAWVGRQGHLHVATCKYEHRLWHPVRLAKWIEERTFLLSDPFNWSEASQNRKIKVLPIGKMEP